MGDDDLSIRLIQETTRTNKQLIKTLEQLTYTLSQSQCLVMPCRGPNADKPLPMVHAKVLLNEYGVQCSRFKEAEYTDEEKRVLLQIARKNEYI